MIKTAYIIIGEGSSGKSTTIRGLTGIVQTKNNWFMRDNIGNDIEMYIKSQSIQEAHWDITKILREIKENQYCLISLRTNRVTSKKNSKVYPDAEDYVAALLEDWNVKIIFLGKSNPSIPEYFKKSQRFKIKTISRKERPANSITADARIFFGWQ